MTMLRTVAGLIAITLLALLPGLAQTCFTTSDMEAPTLAAVQNAAKSYFQLVQTGNTASLQQAAEFNIGDVLPANRELMMGQPTFRSIYLLDSSSVKGGGGRAEFYCGVFNSPDRVGFVFQGLPPGRYAVVIQDVAGKPPATVAWILHQNGAEWKIAGWYVKAAQVTGHDAEWFLNRARQFKAKGQLHNAFLYYQTAEGMIRPFPAMATPQTDKLYDEIQPTRPNDLPFGAPVALTAADGRVFNLTAVFATPVGDALDLVVKYQAADVSDYGKASQDNTAVIKTLVTKYPELRDAFSAVVARAVAPNGQDYGTLLSMDKAAEKPKKNE